MYNSIIDNGADPVNVDPLTHLWMGGEQRDTSIQHYVVNGLGQLGDKTGQKYFIFIFLNLFCKVGM